VLKAKGKYVPPAKVEGESESLKFVDNLLVGKWESWMDNYLSTKLLGDLSAALENPATFDKASKSLLEKMNKLK